MKNAICFWFPSSIAFGCLITVGSAEAQIVPDGTLPNSSVVTPQGNVNVIEGGSRAGGNLFHSFQEFLVPTGGEAFFKNALDVQNIFSRVTGRSISNIDGLIRAQGTANLFLLNPNGIIFGPNARLNIGGSFLASTGNSFKFADGIEFSATNPQNTTLLSINVPIGLQFGANTPNPNAAIIVRGPGNNLNFDPDTLAIDRNNRPKGLEVSPNQTLALIGGGVTLEGGNLTALNGRIELGSVAPESLVTFIPTNAGWQLGYEGVQNFQDIRLTQAASVDTSGSGGGSIQMHGRRISLSDGSAILSLTEGSNSGGNITLRASKSVELVGVRSDGQFRTALTTNVQPKATGNGGNLTIETERLFVKDGAQISVSTFGQGKAGTLTVQATDSVELIGSSLLASSANSGSTGSGGNLTVETGLLIIKDKSQIVTATFGSGKGGTLTIRARDTVELISSDFFAAVYRDAIGDSGDLIIETRRLIVKDGSQISAGTFGQGNGGRLIIKATDSIEAIGESVDGKIPSGLFTSSEDPGSTAKGGDLIVETGQLIVKDGAQITAVTRGKGKAGTLRIRARDSVELIGEATNGKSSSALSVSALRGSIGDGGDLTIETGRLIVKDGAQISAGTLGQGKGGTVTVKATDSTELIGTDAEGKASSGLFTLAAPGSTGNGGNVTIETRQLVAKDGALISAGTRGQGKSGSLTIKATESVELIGTNAGGNISSGLFAPTAPGSTGDGGDLTIETGRLIVKDGAEVAVASNGTGKAGTLRVFADSIKLSNQGFLDASTKAGGGSIQLQAPTITLLNSSITTDATGGESGGDITLNSQFLQLRDRSTITTNATGTEVKGGNITLNTDILAALENSDITANAEKGRGGAITIKAQGIFGAVPRTREELQSLLKSDNPDPKNLSSSDITATGANTSNSGTININTPDVDPGAGLVNLPENVVDTSGLLAKGCIARRRETGTFYIVGTGNLPTRPGDAVVSPYSTGTVRSLTVTNTTNNNSTELPASEWQPNDSIIEAQGVYQLETGQVALGVRCPD